MRNRLRRLESKLTPVGLCVIGISSILDDRVPVGCYGKIINGQELIIQTKEEYLEEISNNDNIIVIGDE